MSANKIHSLNELISYDEDKFLEQAYQVILGRYPDTNGKQYYKNRLNLGVSRIEIVCQLRLGSEGKIRNLQVDGLDEAVRKYKLVKTPIIGKMLSALKVINLKDPSAGNFINQTEVGTSNSIDNTSNVKYQPLEKSPLVSIIVVNMNGMPHIEALAKSLKKQTYKNFEVIFIDNNSIDKSDELAGKIIPNCRVVKCDKNYGFSEANNIGLEHSLGDLLLLLNNDTSAEPNFIEELVNTLRNDSSCAVAVPKILFYKPFVEITIESDELFSIDKSTIESCLDDYKKVISKQDLGVFSKIQNFLIPSTSNKINIPLNFSKTELKSKIPVRIFVENELVTEVNVNVNPSLVTIDISKKKGNWIINNVGSWISAEGHCGDRGIFESDVGQYEEPTEVQALCGCAALIRREVLGNYPLFSPDFFAYFEDAELSIRIRSGGGRIMYCPTSRLLHKHASTSGEGSARFRYLVSRNRLLFLGIHFKHIVDAELDATLKMWNHFIAVDSDEVFPDSRQREFVALLPKLIDEIPELIERAKRGLVFYRQNKARKIGIYNEYWTTLGGGELRALQLAMVLSEYGIVDLISSTPFSLEELSSRFNIKLENMRKIVVKGFSSHDTAEYDLFVNTTHHSNLISMAKKSIFFLNFPHPHVTIDVLRSYDISLGNSQFVMDWAKKRWSPEVPVEVLHPAVNNFLSTADSKTKSRTIISLGRFFEFGHNKKQLELVDAFKLLYKEQDKNQKWQLVLIGACNLEDESSLSYLKKVQKAAKDWDILVLPNASFTQVEDALKSAAIYWHGTGLGIVNPDPEQLEHFGMAITEAMSYGCVPIVYALGGPPEVVGEEFQNLCFNNTEELVKNTASVIQKFESSKKDYKIMSDNAKERVNAFSYEHHNMKVRNTISKLIPNWTEGK